MKTLLSPKHALNNIVKTCLLILLLAGTHLINAQCPRSKDTGCSGNNASFQQGEVVYVDIDSRFQNTQQYTQITAALDAWTSANQTNGSGVIFSYIGNLPPITPTTAVLHVTSAGLTTPLGRPETETVAQLSFGRVTNNNIFEATVTFNTNATAGPKGTPEYSQPYYNPNGSGYDTVFKKKVQHEVGHAMGLCDVPQTDQQSGSSVMNTSVYNCANDVCNQQPQNIQSCDNTAVSQYPKYFPLPSPTPTPFDHGGGGGGGGGTGGGGGGGGGGFGIRCYDVFTGEYYYGCVQGDPICNETVDYKYEGLSCEYYSN